MRNDVYSDVAKPSSCLSLLLSSIEKSIMMVVPLELLLVD